MHITRKKNPEIYVLVWLGISYHVFSHLYIVSGSSLGSSSKEKNLFHEFHNAVSSFPGIILILIIIFPFLLPSNKIQYIIFKEAEDDQEREQEHQRMGHRVETASGRY
jgi:hypothetical protein